MRGAVLSLLENLFDIKSDWGTIQVKCKKDTLATKAAACALERLENLFESQCDD